MFAVGKKFKLYGDFKRHTFAHAVDEINSQYEMDLKFIEYNERMEVAKPRQKITKVRFEFTPSYKIQGYNPATKSMVNVVVKPKRKRNHDDDNTPPSTQLSQQELGLETEQTTGQKILKATAKGLSKVGVKPVPEVQKALDERKDTSVKETIKAVAKGAINADKRRIDAAVETTKKIIETLMKVKNLSEAEAKIFAIEHELI